MADYCKCGACRATVTRKSTHTECDVVNNDITFNISYWAEDYEPDTADAGTCYCGDCQLAGTILCKTRS